jgi:hypothetical protein
MIGLGNQLKSWQKAEFAKRFRQIALRLHEVHAAATDLMQLHPFAMFGLTDAALYSAAAGTLLLTDDGRFASFANSQGVIALDLHTALESQRNAW